MTRSAARASPVIYSNADLPLAAEVIALFRAAELNGPLNESERVEKMLRASQCVITARADGQLIGLIRVLTDFAFNAFVADLAVDPEFQRKGVGTELLTRATNNDLVKYVLQTHESGEFYLKNEFAKADGCYLKMRTR